MSFKEMGVGNVLYQIKIKLSLLITVVVIFKSAVRHGRNQGK